MNSLGSDLVIDCGECINEGESGQLGVFVTRSGDLRIVCHKHESIILYWQNKEVAENLQRIAISGCDGEDCDHEETRH